MCGKEKLFGGDFPSCAEELDWNTKISPGQENLAIKKIKIFN